MKDPLSDFADPLDLLPVDVDIAAVAELPPTTLKSPSHGQAKVEGPALLLPLDAAALARIEQSTETRSQLNAAVVAGALFPLVALQLGDLAIACTFEAADEEGKKLFGAAQRRGWLPVCLHDSGRAIVVAGEWQESSRQLYERMLGATALSVPDYATGINAAIRAAGALFLDQPPARQPRHLSVRILASERRMQHTIEAALATVPSETRH